MSNMRWFLLDTTHLGYGDAIVDCGNRHKRSWPKNILSIVLNNDGNLALVKSDSMGKAYRRGRWAEKIGTPRGIMHDIYDISDHHRALTLLKTSNWSNTRKLNL